MEYTEFELFSSHAHGMANVKVPIRIFRRQHSQASPVHTHRHDFLEIALLLSGTATHVVYTSDDEKLSFPVCRGDVCVILQGQSHAFTFEPTESINIINILFNRSILQKAAAYDEDRINLCDFVENLSYISRHHPTALHLSNENTERICELVSRIESETVGRNPGSGTFILLFFTEILTLLYREYQAQFPEQHTAEVSGLVPQLLSYINHHFQEDISLEKLSQLTHFSTRQITRRFKATMGVSVSEYILMQRITYARSLLTSTDMKITDIAAETGFNNPSYFCEQFRKVVHCTPKEFRNRDFTTPIE